MGCELAVCFSDKLVVPDEIGRALSVQAPSCEKAYLVSRTTDSVMPWTSFFALWTDVPVDLEGVCAFLSESHSATICVAWKSEHGGVAGYLVFRHGAKTDREENSADDYLLLPGKGVEVAFGEALVLDRDDRLVFPEIVLDRRVACHLINCVAGSLVAMPPDTVTQLLEDELSVEPVLPVGL